MFNQRKVRPEDVESFLSVVNSEDFSTPSDIAKKSKLFLTAVHGVILLFEKEGKIELIRNNKTPRVQLRLID